MLRSTEMAARRRSLYHLEKLRLFRAAITVVLTIALLAWAIALWQNGAATTGDGLHQLPRNTPNPFIT